MENTSVFFGTKSKFYDEYAKIQSEIADFTAKFSKKNGITADGFWLDLGSGTGFAKKGMMPDQNINIISLDIALTDKIDICADFDFLPFRENSFDKVISCSAVQWSQNIENLMSNIYKILKKDGIFILSLFENGTLENLQNLQKKWGVIPQVSFYDKNYFEVIITDFNILASESKVFSQKFSDGYSALKSISKIGATNHGGKFLSRKMLRNFVKEYEKSFENGVIIHDYRALFYVLEKGDNPRL